MVENGKMKGDEFPLCKVNVEASLKIQNKPLYIEEEGTSEATITNDYSQDNTNISPTTYIKVKKKRRGKKSKEAHCL